jgi:hypothetical protein
VLGRMMQYVEPDESGEEIVVIQARASRASITTKVRQWPDPGMGQFAAEEVVVCHMGSGGEERTEK